MYYDEYGIYVNKKNRLILDFYNGQILQLNPEYYIKLEDILKNKENIYEDNIYCDLIGSVKNFV